MAVEWLAFIFYFDMSTRVFLSGLKGKSAYKSEKSLSMH